MKKQKQKQQKQKQQESSPTPTRVSLTTDWFAPALDHYIDDTKPDPLSLHQLQGWTLEWKEDTTSNSASLMLPKDQQPLSFVPTQFLQGTLEIGGDYLVVYLPTVCAWSPGAHDSKTGHLYYSIHAYAHFVNPTEPETTAQDKVRTKMAARLRKDAYISKLLQIQHPPVLLAQAQIHVDETTGGLEERVDVSEAICQAIKRAVWSHAESPLDVVEVLLQFPCLPTTIHTSISTAMTTTPLANRAKLRLLEDAMVDACEQEGDGELLDDLTISEHGSSKTKNTNTNGGQQTGNKKSKPSGNQSKR